MKTPTRNLFRSRAQTRTGVTATFDAWRARLMPPTVACPASASSARPGGRPVPGPEFIGLVSAAATVALGKPTLLSARDAGRISAGVGRIGGCLLCPALADHAGTWFPTEEASRRLGAAAGKMRVMAFGLCASCSRLSNVQERIEEKLFAEAAEDLARPESN